MKEISDRNIVIQTVLIAIKGTAVSVERGISYLSKNVI